MLAMKTDKGYISFGDPFSALFYGHVAEAVQTLIVFVNIIL